MKSYFYCAFRWLFARARSRNRGRGRILSLFPLLSQFRNAISPRRIRRIRRILDLKGPYLEIGVQYGHTIEAVRGERVGVDPLLQFKLDCTPPRLSFYEMTSREYFSNERASEFDFVFLDGLHTFQETYLDFVDALAALSPNGVILIDDVLPTDEESSYPDQNVSRRLKLESGISHSRWYGDVWRFAYFLLYGSAARFFRCVGIGGREDGDHGQLLVLPRRDLKWIGNVDKDIEEMMSYSYDHCVDAESHSVSAVSISETKIPGLLRQIVKAEGL